MTHLAGDTALEQHGRVGVDEVEVLQDLDALLVLWQQLEVLLRDSESQTQQSASIDCGSWRTCRP